EEPEPRDQLVRPAALLENRTDREPAHDRAALREGDHGARTRAEPREALAVHQSFVERASGLREADDMTLSDLGEDPWRLALLDNRWGSRNAFADPRMRESRLAGTISHPPDGGPLPHHVLDDAPEPGLDVPVYLRGGAGRQHCREIRKEGLEPQALGEAPLGAATRDPLHQQHPDQPALDDQQADRPDDVPPVELPQGRLMKSHDASRGQAPTIDPPATEHTIV